MKLRQFGIELFRGTSPVLEQSPHDTSDRLAVGAVECDTLIAAIAVERGNEDCDLNGICMGLGMHNALPGPSDAMISVRSSGRAYS